MTGDCNCGAQRQRGLLRLCEPGDDESPAKAVECTYEYRNRLIGREEDGEQVLLPDDASNLANRGLRGCG